MLGSFYLINRNPYLTGAQKLVQARVVAQGVTVALIVASAALEIGDARKGEGRYETVMVLDPNDPEHKHLIEKRVHKESYEGEDLWRDMVEAEERRMASRRKAINEREARDHSTKSSHSHSQSPSSSSSSSPPKPPTESQSQTTHQLPRTTKGKSSPDPRNPGPGPATKQGKGKENKDKILNQINKVSDKSEEEIHEMENAKLRSQRETEGDMRRLAVPSAPADVKVSDRGKY